jgi:class 3 adenylate cyclase
VKAVESAFRIKRDLAERNAGLPEERQLRFRIGLNLGDVLVEAGDLYGEGVNIAARLQALAAPDGILISGTSLSMCAASSTSPLRSWVSRP